MCDYLSRESSRALYDQGHEFQIGKIEMVGNTGTYLDSPFHRYAHGKDLAALALDKFASLDGVVLRRPYQHGLGVDESSLSGLELEGKAVLIHTGWDRHWRTDRYFENHPFLTEAAALYLVKAGVKLVGIVVC